MVRERFLKQIQSKLLEKGHLFLFLGLLIVFAAYTIFLSLNLQTGIIPDETYRFAVSRYFINTWGIPDDVPIIKTAGESLHRGSFLGYWIYGRMLAIMDTFFPEGTEWQSLVYLRLVNALFSYGTVIFTYLLAKEIIKNKWIQLLPSFMLTNTLMFVFLSGGVNYDNPTIFFCSLSLLFFVRIIKEKSFLTNSLAWLLTISIACLIKYSILPLAFIMTVVWIIFIIRNKPSIMRDQLFEPKNIGLFIILIALLSLNFSIYGINIIRYQSITPSCLDVYTEEICKESGYAIRHEEMALPEKLTVVKAFKRGNPEPIRYIFETWIRAMFDRIYGIMGHKIYFPISVSYFLMLIYWTIGLGLRYIRRPSFVIIGMISIILFYALVLIRMNYNSQLVYGFDTSVALQGRYIFPVISLAYVIWGHILEIVPRKLIRYATIFALIALFLYGGPIRFIIYYETVFANWFI
jgi:hypothetical protein